MTKFRVEALMRLTIDIIHDLINTYLMSRIPLDSNSLGGYRGQVH